MLWILLAVMLAAAISVVAVPMYRTEKRFSSALLGSIVIMSVLSGLIYLQIGTPDSSAGPTSELPDVSEMVTSLAARLQENPNDLSGWKMLGRSYFSLRNFPGAIEAFEKAIALESGRDGQTLTDLGEAILYDDQTSLSDRAGDLFENALVLTPGNPKALFYGGMVAIERGDPELAANRWEALLATSPPPNVQEILRQQIAELRGVPVVPVAEAAIGAGAVNVHVSLGDAAAAANLADTTVFVIARDPAQPSPPIAAVRIRLSELPMNVSISDSDAMIPGRVPSGYDRLEIIARVSLAGQPVATSGDWYGDAIIQTGNSETVQIAIDRQVP
ncbi:MAG: tetratricopeptide repeat protein [Proteobacteria bacterium]|nr:tetratricopeptide repeat protein [Pseudomonadota bacterium]